MVKAEKYASQDCESNVFSFISYLEVGISMFLVNYWHLCTTFPTETQDWFQIKNNALWGDILEYRCLQQLISPWNTDTRQIKSVTVYWIPQSPRLPVTKPEVGGKKDLCLRPWGTVANLNRQ